MLTYINQDITEKGGRSILCNGVNCQAVMGSGVAKAFYTKWPVVKESYLSIGKSHMQLGCVDFVLVNPYENTYVANMWTQEFYGNDGRVYASLDAIEFAMNKVIMFALKGDIEFIYMPRIGCGLGGLKWIDVEGIISKVFKGTNLHPIVCDL
jgi:O-acetyl-ADP-ribose deacetylase (regulator of RNase III)